jgi:hypothetical protein
MLVRTMNHRMDLQSTTPEEFLATRRCYRTWPIEGSRPRLPETPTSMNLDEAVNGRVMKTQSHDS